MAKCYRIREAASRTQPKQQLTDVSLVERLNNVLSFADTLLQQLPLS
jgi:hypothetical protein